AVIVGSCLVLLGLFFGFMAQPTDGLFGCGTGFAPRVNYVSAPIKLGDRTIDVGGGDTYCTVGHVMPRTTVAYAALAAGLGLLATGLVGLYRRDHASPSATA